ncbi:hypothetical protein [Parendozoicomonas sp. Alg238-R29]|uniref:hypothetical protein n=1 Tax=Parendozoicomonas sp. Alg238-R29 TaxID=2993446 RepID=UPI00248ED880|nr:hypothetical protein [Parendozoicomonas sp. Alg238-R29]
MACSTKPFSLGKRVFSAREEEPLQPEVIPKCSGMTCKADMSVGRLLLCNLGKHVNLADLGAKVCVQMSCLPKGVVSHMSREYLESLTDQTLASSKPSETVLSSLFSSQEPISPERAKELYAKLGGDEGDPKKEEVFWAAVCRNFTGTTEQRERLEANLKEFLQSCELTQDQKGVLDELQEALESGKFGEAGEAERLMLLYQEATDEDGKSIMHNVLHNMWNLHLIETLLECGVEIQPPEQDGVNNPESEINIAKKRGDFFLASKLQLAYNRQQQKKIGGKLPSEWGCNILFFQHDEDRLSLEDAEQELFDLLAKSGNRFTHAAMFSTDGCDNTAVRLVHWPSPPKNTDRVECKGRMPVEDAKKVATKLGKKREQLRNHLKLQRQPLGSFVFEDEEDNVSTTPPTPPKRIMWGAAKGILTAAALSNNPAHAFSGSVFGAASGSTYPEDPAAQSGEQLFELLAGLSVYSCGGPALAFMGGAKLLAGVTRKTASYTKFGKSLQDSPTAAFLDKHANTVQAATTISTALMALPASHPHWQTVYAASGSVLTLAAFVEKLRTSPTVRYLACLALVGAVLGGAVIVGAGWVTSVLAGCTSAVEFLTSTPAVYMPGLFSANNLSGISLYNSFMGPRPKRKKTSEQQQEDNRKNLTADEHTRRPTLLSSDSSPGTSGLDLGQHSPLISGAHSIGSPHRDFTGGGSYMGGGSDTDEESGDESADN